jgi:hypothetical protein
MGVVMRVVSWSEFNQNLGFGGDRHLNLAGINEISSPVGTGFPDRLA